VLAAAGTWIQKQSKKNTCLHCLGEKFYFDRAFSPCEYTGNIKKLIHEFKYAQKDYLGKPLGSLMNMFIKDYCLPIEYLDFIIPVPYIKAGKEKGNLIRLKF